MWGKNRSRNTCYKTTSVIQESNGNGFLQDGHSVQDKNWSHSVYNWKVESLRFSDNDFHTLPYDLPIHPLCLVFSHTLNHQPSHDIDAREVFPHFRYCHPTSMALHTFHNMYKLLYIAPKTFHELATVRVPKLTSLCSSRSTLCFSNRTSDDWLVLPWNFLATSHKFVASNILFLFPQCLTLCVI